jgi:hypothetical protein
LLEEKYCHVDAQNPDIYHTLGCAYLIKWNCLELMLEHLQKLKKVYIEISVPTAAAATGAKMLSVDSCSSLFEHIRYKPVYQENELRKISSSAAYMVHPVKDDVMEKYLGSI